MNEVHWALVYCVVYLFRVYQAQLREQGHRVTIHQLWEHYCFAYDQYRAQTCFSTAKRREKTLRFLVGENC